MDLLEARSLFGHYKSCLFLTGAILAAPIGPALIYYNHGGAESKPAVVSDEKGKNKKKKEGNRESGSY